MSSRRTDPHPWADHPELLTSIRSPWEKFRKADWNYSRYEDAVMARPCDPEDVVYTALDFCIAIVGLRDWTRKTLARDIKHAGKALPAGMGAMTDFADWITARVPWQSAVEAIANTTKHAEYRDTGWPNGTARPANFFPEHLRAAQEACTDGLQLFALLHQHRDLAWWDIALRQHPSEDAKPGYLAFGAVLDGWKSLLKELGYDAD